MRAYARKYAATHREEKAAYMREWKAKRKTVRVKMSDAERYERKQRNRFRWRLRAEYKMSPEAFDDLIVNQTGRCAICIEPLSEPKETHLDHCHDSKRVRGVLCGHCNRMLGGARDNPAILRAAVRYLG